MSETDNDMDLIDDLLENIFIFEYQRRHAFDLLPSPGRISRTAVFDRVVQVPADCDIKTFKPDTVIKVMALLLALGVWIAIVLSLLFGKIESFPIAIFVLGLFTIVMGTVVNDYIVSNKLNFRITVSGEGLSINDTLHVWKDIKETAIMDLPIGRGGIRVLVILFADNNFESWELRHFQSFPYPFSQKLANYIEHFKALGYD